jgi:tetratricopeptide (TPR) repeat protein
MAKKQWPQAIASYSSALAIVDPKDTALRDVLTGKIAEAGYNAEMEAGDLAMAQKKYDDAIARYLAAQKIKDTDDVKARIAEAEKKKEYWKHCSLANELLGQSAWLKARDEALAAQEVDDTPEVHALLTEIDYRRYLTQGKVFLNQLKPREAQGYFRMAQKAKDTPEVQAYIKQATDRIASQESGAGANK